MCSVIWLMAYILQSKDAINLWFSKAENRSYWGYFDTKTIFVRHKMAEIWAEEAFRCTYTAGCMRFLRARDLALGSKAVHRTAVQEAERVPHF